MFDFIQLEDPSTEPTDKPTDDPSNSLFPPIDKKRRRSIIPSSHLPKQSEENKSSDEETESSEKEDENSFDAFILHNFTPFSGRENIIEWLDDIEKKFHKLRVSRSQRFAAVPLLISGEAKRNYIRIRKQIESFDDFYEYLLTNYEPLDHHTPHIESFSFSRPLHSTNLTQTSTHPKNISFEKSNKMTVSTFDLTDNLPPRPILRSTGLVDGGATGLPGDEPENRSTINQSRYSHTINTNLDDTSYVLRKAIVDNLIKNPKTFQGGKDDVKQWLEDLENLFEIAQIPNSHKLDLIPYSLRGEALRWYKNNKSTLTSWEIFIQEFKEAFLSPFHEELAFKKLESYTQGINQPIRSFYNEVLKLCSEADSTMSESTKLKNLLNKTKPSIQFEIRRKRPTTTKQFLEYAKEIEELFHLSNLDNTADHHKATTAPPITSTIANTNPASANVNTYIPPLLNEHTFGTSNSNSYRNNTNYQSRPSQQFTPSHASYRPNTSPYTNHQSTTYFSQYNSNKPRSSGNYNNNPLSSTQNKPRFQYNSRTGTNNYHRLPHANNITFSHTSPTTDTTPPTSETDFCTRCNRTGHMASACDRF